MSRRDTVFILTIGILLAVTYGCRESSVMPFDGIPATGTRLYIADCEPFAWQGRNREMVTLVPDPADACNSDVYLYSGLTAIWRSNFFRVESGSLQEGVHLVLERNANEMSVTTTVAILYAGVSVDFNRQLELPVGEAVSSADLFETGEIAAGGDSGVVELSIAVLSGAATLNVHTGTGTYVQVDVDRTALCEFQIDLGLAGGVGQPGSGVNFSYQNATGEIQSSLFMDFTQGGHVDGTVFVFGPQYGIAYLAAESGGCRDTARFMALAPAQGFRVDTLETVFRGNLLSDGNQVWFWEDHPLGGDSAACRSLSILYTTEWPLLTHPIYNCDDEVIAYCDAMSQRFWIVERNPSAPDTAWGYSFTGSHDTTVIAETIPGGFLYHGTWLNVTAIDRYSRTVEAFPFGGGASVLHGTIPSDLTEEFGGGGGIGYPGALGYAWWSVNAFDDEANWIARYPVRVGESENIGTVVLLSADSVIVYAANVANQYRVRALKPQ